MRAGNANGRVGVGSIFHSKRLNNDGPLSASSRLVSADVPLAAAVNRIRRAETAARLAIRLLFATRDLSFGKRLGVLSPGIEAKLKRFPRCDPRCRSRPRWRRGEKVFWCAIFRNINLARGAVSGIPSYRRSTGSFAYGYRIWRRGNRCGGCCRTSNRRICLRAFRRPACSEEEQRQENSNRRNESFHKDPLLMVFLEQ